MTTVQPIKTLFASNAASGRLLADELAKEPFGWDFEVVRLLVLSLLRAGKIEATSKGQIGAGKKVVLS
jgi:hypothetical protein